MSNRFRTWQDGPPSGPSRGSFGSSSNRGPHPCALPQLDQRSIYTTETTLEFSTYNTSRSSCFYDVDIQNNNTGNIDAVSKNVEVRSGRFAWRFVSLAPNTSYKVSFFNINPMTKRKNPKPVLTFDVQTKVAARVPRCSTLDGKTEVVKARMSYNLNYQRISFLFKKLFQKIVDIHFAEAGKAHKNTNTRAQRLANEDVYETIRKYLQQKDPLHIELYHLLIKGPSSDAGRTGKFISRFFPGMTVEERREYFAAGFPGGDDEYTRFLGTLVTDADALEEFRQYERDLKNVPRDAEGQPVNNNGKPIVIPVKEPPPKKDPPLRYVIRASGLDEANPDFGYIFLTSRKGGNGGVDDQEMMLAHLSMASPYGPDRRYFEINGVPLHYHVTDACFDVHLFYQFENGAYLGGRPGNRINDDYIQGRNPIDNANGSVTFTHDGTQVTIALAADGSVVQAGGKRRGTRRAKRAKRRNTRKQG